MIRGKRVAILGLGRSGLAVGQACVRLGATAVVFDEKAVEEMAKPELVQEAFGSGVAVVTGYRPQGPWFDLPDDALGSASPEVRAPDIVVTNPAVPKWHPGLRQAAKRGIEVISEVEFAYRISRGPIVAITGTNGKSTTTVMTTLCLRACGVDAVLCGNIFGSGYEEVPLTEAALNSRENQVLVAEVSSFQLEWVSAFAPAVAGITNVRPDHLDRYYDFDEYMGTKLRIFEGQLPGQWQVVPDGDGWILRTKDRSQALGRSGWSDAGLEVLGEWVPLDSLPFAEPHNLSNACMASLLAAGGMVTVGLEPDAKRLVEGLRSFRGIAHRMERLGERGGVAVINNSMCTNPTAVVSSSQAVPGRQHLLIGGANKGLDLHPLVEYLAGGPHRAYLFGAEAQNLHKILGANHLSFSTMQEAFQAATASAVPGETIMLAPGLLSTDQFRDFRHRGDVFKAIAMEWLASDPS
jgi:UDP-N-acetylmuramoylalanine--D-glutamate ligase